MTAPPLTLAAYSDAELNAFYAASDPAAEEWRAILEAEADRRDAADRARQVRRADPVAAEWRDMAHAQYLAAERELKGNLVARGAPETDAFQLWAGPERIARRHATEELNNWWDVNGRITVTGYRDQVTTQRKAYNDDRLAGHDTRRLRPGPETRAARTDAGAGPDGHLRPAGPAYRRPGPAVNARLADLHRRAEALRTAASEPAEPVTGTVVVREPGTVARQQQPVDGALVLGYVRQFIDRYARMPSESAADVVALWAAHAACREPGGPLVFESTPRLMLLSSEPGSGKTRVLNLVRMLCGGRYGLLTEPTAWALAHIVGPAHEAAMIDEADVLFGRGSRKEAVRAVLNSGYIRDGVVAHMRGKTVEDLATFGPVALAGLDVMRTATGASLEPLFTRSIVVRMRKSPDPVPQMDRTAREAGSLLHTALAAWAAQNRDTLAEAPALPDWIANRDGEVWGPLLAVADAAGEDWPNRALTAAAELAGGWEQPQDDGADFMSGLADITAGW